MYTTSNQTARSSMGAADTYERAHSMQVKCDRNNATRPRCMLHTGDCKPGSIRQYECLHTALASQRKPSVAGGRNNPPLQLSKSTLPPVGRNSQPSSVWGTTARMCLHLVLASREKTPPMALTSMQYDDPNLQLM